jgi:hypothetical protein
MPDFRGFRSILVRYLKRRKKLRESTVLELVNPVFTVTGQED